MGRYTEKKISKIMLTVNNLQNLKKMHHPIDLN